MSGARCLAASTLRQTVLSQRRFTLRRALLNVQAPRCNMLDRSKSGKGASFRDHRRRSTVQPADAGAPSINHCVCSCPHIQFGEAVHAGLTASFPVANDVLKSRSRLSWRVPNELWGAVNAVSAGLRSSQQPEQRSCLLHTTCSVRPDQGSIALACTELRPGSNVRIIVCRHQHPTKHSQLGLRRPFQRTSESAWMPSPAFRPNRHAIMRHAIGNFAAKVMAAKK